MTKGARGGGWRRLEAKPTGVIAGGGIPGRRVLTGATVGDLSHSATLDAAPDFAASAAGLRCPFDPNTQRPHLIGSMVR